MWGSDLLGTVWVERRESERVDEMTNHIEENSKSWRVINHDPLLQSLAWRDPGHRSTTKDSFKSQVLNELKPVYNTWFSPRTAYLITVGQTERKGCINTYSTCLKIEIIIASTKVGINVEDSFNKLVLNYNSKSEF